MSFKTIDILCESKAIPPSHCSDKTVNNLINRCMLEPIDKVSDILRVAKFRGDITGFKISLAYNQKPTVLVDRGGRVYRL